MINPEIIPISKKKICFGSVAFLCLGCMQKYLGIIKIYVKYFTPDNKIVEHEAHSTWAALIQHEYDHLNGVLYPTCV